MKNRHRTVSAPDEPRSNESRTLPASRPAIRREHRRKIPSPTFIAALVLVLFFPPGLCQENPTAVPAPRSVSQQTLEAKIQEVEAASGIEEEAKAKLLELYRKAVGNLQTAAVNAQAEVDFRRAEEAAPAQIQAIREAMEKGGAMPPEDTLGLDAATPPREIEQLLQKEKADQVAVDAKRADLEKQLEEEAGRPALIRERLTEAREQLEDVAAQLKLPPPADVGPTTAEARRWALETRFDALSTEIKMLDRELLSQPARVELLEAKRDKAAASVQWVGTRVELLEALVNRKRKEEAEQAKAEAEATRRGAVGKHPLVEHLAGQNALLSEELAQMASELDALTEQTEQAEKISRRIEAHFKRAEATIAIGGLTQELGHMLRVQRQSLPDLRAYRRAVMQRRAKTAEVGVRRLRHQEEESRLGDLDEYVAGILKEAATKDAPLLREQLDNLAQNRKILLDKAINADEAYLRRLNELESAQRRLLKAIEDYDAFLDENLLWARSTSLFQLDSLDELSAEMQRVLSPSGGRELVQTLVYQATHSPVFTLLAVALAALVSSRRYLLRTIRNQSDKLGKPTTDRFGYTLQTLALTLVAAAGLPLVVAVTGWQLKVSVETTTFTTAVGESLLAVAVHFYQLRAFRLICMPRGLAAAHFRWPESSLRVLRKQLDFLTWIFVPAALVTLVTLKLDPLEVGWSIGRLAFLTAIGSLTFSFYRLLHPTRGILVGYMRGRGRRTFKRLYPVWYPLVIIYLLGLGILTIVGFLYTAGTLTELFLKSAWLVVDLVLVAAIAERWLLVTRRRLAYEVAMERRQAEAADGSRESLPRSGEDGTPFEAEEPEVDVVDLSDRSRKLVNTAILLYGLFGFWLIWSDLFPALSILDQVTLWHHKVMVDGAEQILPVTLASLGLALIYGAITIILARQLPAVLEIVLLHYSEMSAGGRYTVTTLANYVIVTTGIVLVFKTIGADWSQLQWLVAALGVGIGFGLQEIVANFISGIIVLFERPIRIGDVVTVGDTDGVVTRIRSRATTIRNWDGKELLVPNKEFITGRLLNWSLSDQKTRVILSIGIAYGSDVRQAMRLLEEAARENENVLADPPPSVIFEAFGDNALAMALRCFVDSADLRYPTISALNEAINSRFNAAGIVIAFPQRDLHLDTTRPLQVELRRGREGPREADT
ncbi:MAG: mechanosensitive ion channel [Chromatiaceae bacterium]|nr:mechanosensitive ion channel [Chromatiaceae bacterium]